MHNCLIINGAGEGNRTLVSIARSWFNPARVFQGWVRNPSCATQELVDLRPERFGGLVAFMLPAFEASDTYSERCRNVLLRQTSS
jgi:hypothetical protein